MNKGSFASNNKTISIKLIEIVKILKEYYPEATCSLDFTTPFEMLVAVMLSAQCTDARVNLVTPALFARFPDAESFASADVDEIEELIRSTGFYHNKAKNIKNCSIDICEKFGGGGHKGAAGASMKMPLEEAAKAVEAAMLNL